jgi:hypothetical protein
MVKDGRPQQLSANARAPTRPEHLPAGPMLSEVWSRAPGPPAAAGGILRTVRTMLGGCCSPTAPLRPVQLDAARSNAGLQLHRRRRRQDPGGRRRPPVAFAELQPAPPAIAPEDPPPAAARRRRRLAPSGRATATIRTLPRFPPIPADFTARRLKRRGRVRATPARLTEHRQPAPGGR